MLGDRNTRYFHTRAKQRFRRNRIKTLKDKNDVWINSRPEIVSCITSHFHEITTIVNPCLDQNMIDMIPVSIDSVDNDMLCTIPSLAE